MLKFIVENKILCKEQFGFRKLHSTGHVLSDIFPLSIITGAIVFSPVLFLDLKKAFDTVDHQTLLSQLEKLRFRGNFYNLLKDYLKNRKQYVNVNNVSSHLLKISTGVPQRIHSRPNIIFVICKRPA